MIDGKRDWYETKTKYAKSQDAAKKFSAIKVAAERLGVDVDAYHSANGTIVIQLIKAASGV